MNFREDIYGRDRQLQFALRTRESNLVFCGNNNAQKDDLLARCTTPNAGALSTAEDSWRVDAAAIEPTGEVTGNPMTGL